MTFSAATFATSDLCDAHEDRLDVGLLRVLPPGFLSFGKEPRFYGQAVTVRAFEDSALVRSVLDHPGAGRVLAIDGGGSRRCAVVGAQLAALAQVNGWAGIVLDGCVRDIEELNAGGVGIRAIAVHPRKCPRAGTGLRDIRLSVGGIDISPGNWIYADSDGVLVSDEPLH
jgi:regulator of ribonuclease activity A